jgi:hypothetical protein
MLMRDLKTVDDLSVHLQWHAEEEEQAAARRAARIAWHVEALHDDDWRLESMNNKLGTNFRKEETSDAFEALQAHVEEGEMEMTYEQYAQWRQDWERELGDQYEFERTRSARTRTTSLTTDMTSSRTTMTTTTSEGEDTVLQCAHG